MLETALGRNMQKRLKFSIVCIAGALLSLAGTAPLRAADPTVAGFWEAYEDGRPGGWFLFFERDGLFQGALVKAFNKPGEQPQLTCAKCTDERKNAPMIGLVDRQGHAAQGPRLRERHDPRSARRLRLQGQDGIEPGLRNSSRCAASSASNCSAKARSGSGCPIT